MTGEGVASQGRDADRHTSDFPGLFPVTEGCPELRTPASSFQRGYKATFEHLRITERNELHNSLTAKTRPEAWGFWSSISQQSQLAVLRKLEAQQKPPSERRAPPWENRNRPADQFAATMPLQLWMKELAGAMPLPQLEQRAPLPDLLLRRSQLLGDMYVARIPLLRATWAIKLLFNHTANHSEAQDRHGGRDVVALNKAWTKHFTQHCEDLRALLPSAVNQKPEIQDLASLSSFLASHCSQAAYSLSVFGETYREGMVDVASLVSWVLQQAKREEPGSAPTALLLPILSLILPDVVQSQLQTQEVVDLCLHHLELCSRRAAARAASAGCARVYGHILQRVLRLAPFAFVGMDILRFHTPASTDSQPGVVVVLARTQAGARTGGDSEIVWSLEPEVQRLAANVLKRRAALGTAVQAKVLGYSTAELVQDIEEGVAALAPDVLVEKLKAKVFPWRQGKTAGELLGVICEWACGAPAVSIAMAYEAISAERANYEIQSSAGGRRIHALNILSALAGLERQSVPVGKLALQGTFVDWLDAMASATCRPHDFESRQAVALLVKVAEAGLFCPGAYLQHLIARGWAPPPLQAVERHREAAAFHLNVLEQLHPDLRLPSLDDAPDPRTPGNDVQPTAARFSSPALRRYAGTRAKVLEKWRWQLEQASGTPPEATGRKKRVRRSHSHEESPRPSKIVRLGSTSREGSPSLAISSRASGLSGLESWRSTSLFTSGDTTGQEGSGASGSAAALTGMRPAVQLSLDRPSSCGGVDGAELLLAAANLRCWEQRALVSWLVEQVGEDHERSMKAAARDPAFVPWVVALMEAAGGHAEAVGWLIDLLEASGTTETAGWIAQACAILGARMDFLSALGLLPRLLSACLLPHRKAAHPHLSMQTLAAEMLRLHRREAGMQSWWQAVQADGSHRRADLQKLRENGTSDTAPSRMRLAPSTTPTLNTGSIDSCPPALTAAIQACLSSPSSTQVEALVACVLAWQAEKGPGGGCFCLAVKALIGRLTAAASDFTAEAVPAAVQALLSLAGRARDPQQLLGLSQGVVLGCFAGVEPIRAHLLGVAVAAGLVDAGDVFKACLDERGPNQAHTLQRLAWLLSPCTAAAVTPSGASLAAELNLLQYQLPKELLWEAICLCWQKAGQDCEAAKALLAHRPLAAGLLRDPGWLKQRLAAAAQQFKHPRPHAPWELALALVLGRGDSAVDAAEASAQQSLLAERGARLLSHASALSQPLLALLLRCNLDQQVVEASVSRGIPAAEAAAAAARAAAPQASGGAPQISEEEKSFTSQVLAQLLVQPGKAAVLAGLVWGLGRGLGDYLLQQIDWLLQDSGLLTGRQPLRAVLQQRSAGLPQAQDAASAANDFALEAGLAEMALVCLANSPAARLKFAEQVVGQLRRLGRVTHKTSGQGLAPAMASTEFQGSQEEASQQPPASSAGMGRQAWRSGRQLTAGSPEGVQVAVWLRLAVLPPLLPLIYAERPTEPPKSLKAQLAGALLHLLASPAIYLPAASGEEVQEQTQRALCELVEAAEARAGEPVFDRLLAVQAALLSGRWASWLRGSKANLREVPPFDCRQLLQELSAMQLPAAVKARVQSVLNSMPSRRGRGRADPADDPWMLPGPDEQRPPPCYGVHMKAVGPLKPGLELLPPPCSRP